MKRNTKQKPERPTRRSIPRVGRLVTELEAHLGVDMPRYIPYINDEGGISKKLFHHATVLELFESLELLRLMSQWHKIDALAIEMLLGLSKDNYRPLLKVLGESAHLLSEEALHWASIRRKGLH